MSCIKALRKIQSEKIEVDSLGKAKQFRLFSIIKPHMRGFHASWFCFFLAFTTWFGLQPLLPTIRKELKLSKVDLANSGIATVSATMFVRALIGPLCDRFGPRRVMSLLLISGAIPMALAGLIRDRTGLIILRLVIGVLGGCFVPCQFWTSSMFSPKVVGTANAIVGGWGNLGGGFAFLLMPGLFQLTKACGAHEFLAWKIAVVIPSIVCVITGISIIFTTDDCPQGHWQNRKLPTKTLDVEIDVNQNSSENKMEGVTNLGFDEDTHKIGNGVDYYIPQDMYVNKAVQTEDIKHACSSNKCWLYLTVVILIIQYGMCFGIEISVNTVMNLYFMYRFKKEGCVEGIQFVQNGTLFNMTNGTTTNPEITDDVNNECSILDQDTGSLVASLFGLTNLFARALGGIYSDILRKHLNIAGRLLAHFTCMAVEGILLIIFSQMNTIPTAMAVMVAFSIFVQMSEGTTYAIVPYLAPRRMGIIAGLVGAGGNAGAFIWNTIWARLVDNDPSRWFWILGITVVCGSFLTAFLFVQQQRIWHVFTNSKLRTRKYKEEQNGEITKF